MILPRILAVVSAAFLVVAFSLAVLLPPQTWLGEAVSMVNQDWLVGFQNAVRGSSEWSWGHLVMPLLVRPAWFLPAAFGLVFGGLAVTLSRRGPVRSRRRS